MHITNVAHACLYLYEIGIARIFAVNLIHIEAVLP